MQERRELHTLAARELRQSVADDQRLERVRLLVRRKSGIIGERVATPCPPEDVWPHAARAV